MSNFEITKTWIFLGLSILHWRVWTTHLEIAETTLLFLISTHLKISKTTFRYILWFAWFLVHLKSLKTGRSRWLWLSNLVHREFVAKYWRAWLIFRVLDLSYFKLIEIRGHLNLLQFFHLLIEKLVLNWLLNKLD